MGKSTIDDLIKSLEQTSNALFCWSKNNLQGKADKCHTLMSTNDYVGTKVGSIKIANTVDSL